MTDHEDLRLSLGSYLTGALAPTARAEMDEHLRHCDACRAELVDLAALPGLLGRLGPGLLGTGPPDHALVTPAPFATSPVSAVSAAPPEGLLSGLLAQARRIEDRSRRRLRRLRAATAAAAGVAVVAAAFAVAPALTPTPGTSYQLRAEASSSPGVAGRVTLLRKPWGTELALSLHGLPPHASCQVIVTGVGGQRSTIGDWAATPDRSARLDAASDMSPAQLASVTVETVAGARLLGVTFSQAGS